MMGTEILKIEAEMPEKIEVEVGTKNTDIIFCHSFNFQVRVGSINFNFLRHFCIDFQKLCAHHEEEIFTGVAASSP